MFVLSSLLSIIEEQVESPGNEELMLVGLWPFGSRGSITTTRTGGVAGQRMDATTEATLTTSSPVAPTRASRWLARATTTLVGARKAEYSSGKHKSKGGFDK
jgi:hypothetical protein